MSKETYKSVYSHFTATFQISAPVVGLFSRSPSMHIRDWGRCMKRQVCVNRDPQNGPTDSLSCESQYQGGMVSKVRMLQRATMAKK